MYNLITSACQAILPLMLEQSSSPQYDDAWILTSHRNFLPKADPREARLGSVLVPRGTAILAVAHGLPTAIAPKRLVPSNSGPVPHAEPQRHDAEGK